MNLSHALRRVREILRTGGPGELFRRGYRRILPRRVPPHPFDLVHGVDTGGLIPTQQGDHPQAAHGTSYWGTAPSLLRGSLARWQQTLAGTGYTRQEYTFIDMGCGKGRALMLASETPFRSILGIELNPALVAVAESNLARWRQTAHPCDDLKVVCADALTAPLPEEPLVLYLYNPFDSAVTQALLDRLALLAASREHPIDMLYARPEHFELFDRVPGIQVLWRGEIPYTAEDTAADVFDTTQQQCFIYRMPGTLPS